jgi:hypothetical protein
LIHADALAGDARCFDCGANIKQEGGVVLLQAARLNQQTVLKAIPFDLTLYADFIFELTAPCQRSCRRCSAKTPGDVRETSMAIIDQIFVSSGRSIVGG